MPAPPLGSGSRRIQTDSFERFKEFIVSTFIIIIIIVVVESLVIKRLHNALVLWQSNVRQMSCG